MATQTISDCEGSHIAPLAPERIAPIRDQSPTSRDDRHELKRIDARYGSGKVKSWVKVKNPEAAPAVLRFRENHLA